MKILSRLLVVVVVLVGLAYSSYTLGRYVLSTYLFGPQTAGADTGLATVAHSTKVAEHVTRQTDWKGKKPRVELKVLPAQEAGPGPDLPLTAMQQDPADVDDYNDPSPSSTLREPAPGSFPADPPRRYESSRNVDNAPLDYSLSGQELRNGERRRDEERPRRRRRRRRKPAASPNVTTPAPSSDTNYYPAADTPVVNDERPQAPVISDSSGSSNTYSGTLSSPAPSTRKRPRKRPRRKPARQRHESPVPRPEGNSGGGRMLDSGESPVPMPE